MEEDLLYLSKYFSVQKGVTYYFKVSPGLKIKGRFLTAIRRVVFISIILFINNQEKSAIRKFDFSI